MSLRSKARVPQKAWLGKGCEESTVIVESGDLVCGILDKNQFGAASNGLVHVGFLLFSHLFSPPPNFLLLKGLLRTLWCRNCWKVAYCSRASVHQICSTEGFHLSYWWSSFDCSPHSISPTSFASVSTEKTKNQEQGDKKRLEVLEESKSVGKEVIVEFVGLQKDRKNENGTHSYFAYDALFSPKSYIDFIFRAQTKGRKNHSRWQGTCETW